jgi:type IV secretory pathway VirB10-like protein
MTVNPLPKITGVLCVVLLHVGLLWLLNEARTGRPEPVATTDLRVTVRMLPAEPPLAPITPAAIAAPNTVAAPPVARRAARSALRPAAPGAATPQTADPAAPAPIAPTTPAAPTIAAMPPTQPASAAASIGSLLDSDATRRAIRASARAPSLTDRAATASGEPAPLSTPDRMAQSIAGSAKGDCAKGEYLGGGMGLLSLPFLAAAALSEQCSSR